jgi:Tetratricopeptide repeat
MKTASFLLVSIVAVVSTPVAADENQGPEVQTIEEESISSGAESEAKAAFTKGINLFHEKQYDDAAEAFSQAYKSEPTWKLFFNIGQCYAATKKYGLAIEAFERYLGEGGDDISDERRTKVLNELDQFRRMVGNVKIVGRKPGVDVVIDGVPRGVTPLSKNILVTAGVEHTFVFFEDGVEVLTVKDSVNGGVTLELTIPGEEVEARPVEPVDGEPRPEQQVILIESQREPQPVAEQDNGISPAGFGVFLGVTVLFAGTAVLMEVLVGKKYEDAEEEPPGKGLTDMQDAGKAMQAVGYAAIGLAAAAGITTAILIPFTDFGGSNNDDVAFSMNPWGDENGGGLSIKGRF